MDGTGDRPLAPRVDAEQGAMKHMTIGEHLDELRKRLFYAVIGLFIAVVACLFFGKSLIRAIELPFTQAVARAAEKAPGKIDQHTALKFTDVTGPFTMYLKISFFAALVIAAPWVFYQLWMFVAAGLYQRERKWVQISIPFSVLLFLLGAWFAVFLSIPAIEFFILFGAGLDMEPIVTLTDYVDFMTNLVLAFGVVFEMPLVVLLLAKIGLMDMKKFNHFRPHVVVIIAVIAAVLAPPDFWSMVAMILPMWVLYEFGVLLAWLLILRKQKPVEIVD